ncbi:ubiquitin-conjugating enzyme/RWD-like protein [Tribonema minus]|uniref:Ubiquitin-conjugating enzyme/RWD-like protein n=1 Tax=Tribonema minus TaxID=303371 RepID=A0A835ZFF1_9STRA|nr:ubiquitin-conjugating enzyme/RWD-like protein [Tribonema minus]
MLPLVSAALGGSSSRRDSGWSRRSVTRHTCILALLAACMLLASSGVGAAAVAAAGDSTYGLRKSIGRAALTGKPGAEECNASDQSSIVLAARRRSQALVSERRAKGVLSQRLREPKASREWREQRGLMLRGGGKGSLSKFQLFMQIFIPGYGEDAAGDDGDGKAALTSAQPGLAKRVKRFLSALFSGGKKQPTKGAKGGKGKGGSSKDDTVGKHLASKHRPGDANYRIQKELQEFMKNPPEGCQVSVGKSLKVWIITITGAKGTIFEGEKFKLRVGFPENYPLKPPSVYFLQDPPPPEHEHVYTNGDICLSLLGKDWTPNLTASALALSILSMLSSAKEKRRPADNFQNANRRPGQSQDSWIYHDNFS